MAAVAAPAEPAPGGAPGAPALLSVRALPENATQAERNKAKKTWPPVENGGRFVLFVDDLRLDEYTTPRCDVRMVVHHDGSLSCDEPNCENPPFGASTYTRAAASAAKHLRAYHLKKLVRSAIVDTDAKKNEVEPWVAPCCAACCCGWSLQLIVGALATRGVRALHLRAVRWPAQRTSARAATRAAAERTAAGAVLCSYFFG